jgi:protein SCO1/2
MKSAATLALVAGALALAACLNSGLPSLGEIPAFDLTASDGTPFRSAERLAGKVWVADFIFTTCHGPCPRMTALMRRVQDATKDMPDVELVSVTIDPATDTPDVLAAYARAHGADPARWHFLTGTMEKITGLGYDSFHLVTDKTNPSHSSRFALVDRKGKLRGYYESAGREAIAQLLDDIGRLRKEVL